MVEPLRCYPKEIFVPEELIGQPVLEAFKSLVLVNTAIAGVEFLIY